VTVRMEEMRPGVVLVTIDRPESRNAIDGPTAARLADAFRNFDADPQAKVAVLTGAGGTFCSGADLKALGTEAGNRVETNMDADAPLGPTRLQLSKPVIAAVEGHAVAGGLELAIWCDLRVAARDAVFGVYCRRWGVPLVDGGTVRLPRLIGHSHALDLILTGRGVSGEEARSMGLANRLVEPGQSLDAALDLAGTLAAFPQECLRSDRFSSYEQWSMPFRLALENETKRGLEVVASEEMSEGVGRFVAGDGRGGT
jgi:enoyl-CoA hydratase